MFTRPRLHALFRRLLGGYRSLGLLADRRLATLGAANVFDTMSVALMAPLLPLYADRLGAGPALVGLVFAAETATQAVLSVPFGHLGDRVDRRIPIVAGTVLSGASVAALAVAATPWLVVGLRALDGAAGALRAPATGAYLGDAFPAERRGRAMGAYHTLGWVGLALGPALGGLLAARSSLALPFLLLGAVTTLAGVALVVALPAEPGGTDAGRDDPSLLALLRGGDRAVWRRPALLVLALTSVYGGFSAGVFGPLYPLLLDARGLADPGYVGAVWSAFGLAMLLVTPVGGELADRVGRVPAYVAGKATWTVVYAGVVLAGAGVLPLLLLFLGGAGSAVAGPAKGALDYEVAPDGREGTFSGLFGALGSAGQALGPLVGGGVAALVGPGPVLVLLGVAGLADALLVVGAVRDAE